MLGKNTGGDLVDLGDELEHGVVRKVLESELALGDVTRIGLAENGVTVTGDDTTAIEGGPEVVGDGLVGEIVADDLLHLLEPDEDFLVGETVEGTGETVETGGEREVRRGESRADQVGGVGGDVATFVIGVDGQVKTHQLNKVLVVAEAELVGQVEGVILVLLDGSDLAILEDVAVDLRGDGGQLGDEVHAVLEGVLPVLLLVDTLGVGLGESGLVLESSDGERELRHGVEGAGAAVDQLLDELGEIGASGPLSREVADLLLRGNLAGKEKPEETFGERLAATGSLGQAFLAFGDLCANVSISSSVEELRNLVQSCRGSGYPPQSRGRSPSIQS